MSQKFDEVLSDQLASAGIQVSEAVRTEIRTALDARMSAKDMPGEVSGDVRRVSDDLTVTAVRILEELSTSAEASGTPAPEATAPIADELREAARLEFLKLRTAPPRIVAMVASSEVRALGGSENVTRLRLKVSEDGVEWATTDADGTERDRLVPE